MNPRPPPARPHIGFHLSSFQTADWAEDDVWDSTSDSESPRQSTLHNSWGNRRPPSVTAPKAVPNRTASNSSSSTLAFSYTHLQAPNPGSYPPQREVGDPNSPKNGWTIVRTVRDRNNDDVPPNIEPGEKIPALEPDLIAGDIEVEGDMILGDLEPEMAVSDAQMPIVSLQPQLKYNTGADSIRSDIDDIVGGSSSFPGFLSVC